MDSIPEFKRLQSIKQKVKLYQQQKSTIKAAFSILDNKSSKKIVFDEDCNVQNGVDENHKELQNRKQLFENEDEDDNIDFNFNNHFNGEAGKKLFELQSKFKGDKRFKLDERFIESAQQSNDVCTSDFPNEEEKKNDLNILEQVLGTKFKSNDTVSEKKRLHTNRMLRFDPTQSKHVQYEFPTTSTKKIRKTKRQPSEEKDNENEKAEQPVVSKDVFYKVDDNFNKTLQTHGQFNVSALFKEDADEAQFRDDEEEGPQLENRTSLLLGSNPFCYDSSDDELENIEVLNQAQNSDNNVSTFKLAYEPFFFKEDDFRLQEGSDFIRRIASESTFDFMEQKRNLKHIIKAKVKNNNRKNQKFKKKLGGRSTKRKQFRNKRS